MIRATTISQAIGEVNVNMTSSRNVLWLGRDGEATSLMLVWLLIGEDSWEQRERGEGRRWKLEFEGGLGIEILARMFKKFKASLQNPFSVKLLNPRLITEQYWPVHWQICTQYNIILYKNAFSKSYHCNSAELTHFIFWFNSLFNLFNVFFNVCYLFI